MGPCANKSTQRTRWLPKEDFQHEVLPRISAHGQIQRLVAGRPASSSTNFAKSQTLAETARPSGASGQTDKARNDEPSHSVQESGRRCLAFAPICPMRLRNAGLQADEPCHALVTLSNFLVTQVVRAL